MSSTAITKPTTTAARPSTLSQAAWARISSTFNRIVPAGGRGEIAQAQAPTPAERQAMSARVANLRESMAPAGRAVIETLVGSLLAGFPVGRGHRDDVDAVMKMFVQALSGLPSWAISSACSAWNRGEAGGKNTSFAPAPPDLRDLALKAAHEFQREQHMITTILNAEIIPERESDEVRAAVVARVKAFAENLGERPQPVPTPAETFDEWEARTKAEIAEKPISLSSEALKTIPRKLTDAELEELRNPPAKASRAA
jgi:hypothetical protein